jgi:hypothetical protein
MVKNILKTFGEEVGGLQQYRTPGAPGFGVYDQRRVTNLCLQKCNPDTGVELGFSFI